MPKGIIYLFLSSIFLISCSKGTPEIRSVCERTPTGSYLIKWETFPPLEGSVKIYESSKLDSFNLNLPVFEENIQSGYKSLLPNPTYARSYFQLIFNKKYSIITADRVVPMERIYNFRDLGGYFNKSNKQSQWGKLYRSGSLAQATRQDIEVLNQLGINTLIDLRTEQESYRYPSRFQARQIFNLPLRGNRHNLFFDKILSEKMTRDDVINYLQQVFVFQLENNSDYFIKMFDVLLDEDNYPIVFYCSLGKDRSAIAAALILAALDIEQDAIISDYLLSNDLINYHSLIENADMFPLQVQETLTAMHRAHEQTLASAFDEIKKEYGSVQNYLEKELQLTAKKRDKLKDLLLYQQID